MAEVPVDFQEREFTIEELRNYVPAIKGILLSTKEVALVLRSSLGWVEKAMRDGTFPFRWYMLGPRLRMCDSEDLNEWILKRRIEAAAIPEVERTLEGRIKKRAKK